MLDPEQDQALLSIPPKTRAMTADHARQHADRMTPELARRVVRELLDGDQDPNNPAQDIPVNEQTPQIPGYRLERPLGEGGAGRVFLGYSDGSAAPVAIKLMRHRLGSSPQTQRAWRELDVLSQVRSPFVPRLLDFGSVDGRLYIVTELVQGCRLDEYCDEKKLDVRARARLLARIADAVHDLHTHGVIHRDLKPANILITDSGDPLIIDLGVASLLVHDVMESLTQDGAPVGTPAFMAPEQARGERHRVSTRSDVYALGATALCVLTGHTPHDPDSSDSLFEVVHRIGHDEPRDPRTLDPSIPRPLAAILRKATAFRPEDRYASAPGLAADLRRWLAREPVHAAGLTVWQRTGRWVGRHPVAGTAAACLSIAGMILGGAFVGASWLNQQPSHVSASSDRTVVRLFSRSGRPLHEWRSKTQYSDDLDAVLIPRDPETGRSALVLTLIPKPTDPSIPDKQLCVWKASDPTHLLWSSPAGAPDLSPPQPSNFGPEEGIYEASSFIVEDIFEDLPGDEIVVLTQHAVRSSRAVLVFDMDGKLLYEFWHDGEMSVPVWLSGTRMLVFSGRNRAHDWEDRLPPGHDNYQELVGIGPQVLFGVRPRLGAARSWINPDSGVHHPDLAFYRCILPIPEIERFRLYCETEPDVGLRSKFFRVHFILVNDNKGFNIRVDSAGRFVPGSIIPTDGFKRLTAVPDPGQFSLGDLPPVLQLPSESGPPG